MAVNVCYTCVHFCACFPMPLHVILVGGGLGTTLRISIWRDFFCGNVPVFIHVVADLHSAASFRFGGSR